MNKQRFLQDDISDVSMHTKNTFAEVIESSITKFVAVCWQWDVMPTFGSLVYVSTNNNIHVLGIVVDVVTGSSLDNRSPAIYKKTYSELKRDQPQIFEFIQTICTMQIVGYLDKNNKVIYQLPLKPCGLHDFVKFATADTQKIFFSSVKFLPMIFAFESKINVVDELLLVIVSTLFKKQLWDTAMLKRFFVEFNFLTQNDYRRLKVLSSRIIG